MAENDLPFYKTLWFGKKVHEKVTKECAGRYTIYGMYKQIADMWSAYHGKIDAYDPADVAFMLMLVDLVRVKEDKDSCELIAEMGKHLACAVEVSYDDLCGPNDNKE